MSRRHGHGPKGSIRIDLPEGLLAMASGGRGGGWGPFHFDFGGEGDPGRRGGRGGRRRTLESGKLRLVLLKLLADEPRHGYDLIKAIEEITGGSYAPSPGVVYPTITLLEDMGLIAECTLDAFPTRRVFSATDEGRKHLDENSKEVEQLFARLEELAPEQRSQGSPPIGRAVRNLMTALGQRVGRDGFDEELLHEIAAILDDAAQRIERVKSPSAD